MEEVTKKFFADFLIQQYHCLFIISNKNNFPWFDGMTRSSAAIENALNCMRKDYFFLHNMDYDSERKYKLECKLEHMIYVLNQMLIKKKNIDEEIQMFWTSLDIFHKTTFQS